MGAQDYINQLKSEQTKSAIASLKKARDASLSALDSEKATIAPEYYKKRAEESTGSQLDARNTAEFMANRGQTNAGVSGQTELNRTVALRGVIGNLDTAESNAFADIAKRRTAVESDYENNLAAAKSSANAQALQNLISQSNADRSYGLQEKQMNNALNQQSLDNQYRNSRAAEEDNRWLNQYRTSQQQYSDSQSDSAKRYQDQLNQQAFENQLKQQQLAIQQSNAARAASNSNTDSKNSTATASRINSIANSLDNAFMYKDGTDGTVKMNPNISASQMRQAIISYGLSDQETIALLSRYGLPIQETSLSQNNAAYNSNNR